MRDVRDLWDRCVPEMTLAALLIVGMSGLLIGLHPGWFSSDNPKGWVYNYQTLIAGILALVAAILGAAMTGLFVLNQTQQAATRLSREDDRRARAARALLPHTLSALIDYLEDCLEMLDSIRGGAHGHIIAKTALPPRPILSPEVTIGLYNGLLDIDEPAKPALRAILKHAQVQVSRLKGYYDALTKPTATLIVGIDNIDTAAMDTAAIYARAEKLFPFARDESEKMVVSTVTYQECFSILNRQRFSGIDRTDWSYELSQDRWDERYGSY